MYYIIYIYIQPSGEDISDYFNYGFDEASWLLYQQKQIAIKSDLEKAKLAPPAFIPMPPAPPPGMQGKMLLHQHSHIHLQGGPPGGPGGPPGGPGGPPGGPGGLQGGPGGLQGGPGGLQPQHGGLQPQFFPNQAG